MIAQLRGTLVDKGLDSIVIDVGGVGFQVAISLQTLAALPETGAQVHLRTYLQVREDALSLFGFATEEERRAFELCIGVTGIGPRLALATLSGLSPGQLADAVARGDTARLSRVPGIGKKTAERLVMELRDKFEKAGIAPAGGAAAGRRAGPGAAAAAPLSGVAATVVAALCNLGYKPAEAERAAEQALKERPDDKVEVILRTALQSLQRG